MKLQKRSERDPSITVEGIDDTPLDVDKFSDGLKGAVFKNEQASAVRPRVVDINNLKYDIVADPSLGRSDMFVPINNASGAMIIRLNTEHPLYQTLQHISGGYEDRDGELDVQQLNAKLTKAMTTIRKMIIAFSRAELEAARSPAEKELLEGVRREWSNITRDLIDEEE